MAGTIPGHPDWLPAPSAIAFTWTGPDADWTADDRAHPYDGADTQTVKAMKTTDRRLKLSCRIFSHPVVPVTFDVKMPDLRPAQAVDIKIDWEKDGVRLFVAGRLTGTKTWDELGLTGPDTVNPDS